MMQLVMGSANPDKVAEMAELLSGFDILPRPESLGEVIEDAPTLEGNARLKARAVCAAAEAAAVSDDTGLEVDALAGEPGVFSARYGAELPGFDDDPYGTNVDKLLAAMVEVPDGQRTARFRTVVIVAWPDGTEVVAEGVCEGRIGRARIGDGGFGYDPVFLPDEAPGESFATMSSDAKHAISHRGRALRALASKIG
ncbi:MAG: XTP/dITP diphosphohydrolase [Candidatus Poriferisodalaceae bacterium]|jgi:XTP/dITP diphosphohydrolase